MGFRTTVVWTAQGKTALQLLMNNAAPPLADRDAFFGALNDCVQGFAAMKFSYFPPEQSQNSHSGYGQINWQDGAHPRKMTVSFYFNTARWQRQVGVTMEMTGVTGA